MVDSEGKAAGLTGVVGEEAGSEEAGGCKGAPEAVDTGDGDEDGSLGAVA